MIVGIVWVCCARIAKKTPFEDAVQHLGKLSPVLEMYDYYSCWIQGRLKGQFVFACHIMCMAVQKNYDPHHNICTFSGILSFYWRGECFAPHPYLACQDEVP